MSIQAYLKIIGRGKDGARALEQTQALDLFSAALDGGLSDLQLGAFLMAMRIKGETTQELEGFLQAARARSLCIDSHRPVVLLPTYNGARRLPNLTPLLARLLTLAGHRVLLHGPELDAGRTTSAQIFKALSWPIVRCLEELHEAWAAGLPVLMPIDVLSPSLSRMLETRRSIGLRGPGHTVAKLLDPVGGGQGLRVIHYTHPHYAQAHADFLRHSKANALLMRGTEGEPVADARRALHIDVYLNGSLQPDLSVELAAPETREPLPTLAAVQDPGPTAAYINHLLEHRNKTPAAIVSQLECIDACLRHLPANL